MKSFETPNGKKIDIIYAPNSSLLKVQFGSGGELPLELSGFFTEERKAEEAILTYLSTKKKKND